MSPVESLKRRKLWWRKKERKNWKHWSRPWTSRTRSLNTREFRYHRNFLVLNLPAINNDFILHLSLEQSTYLINSSYGSICNYEYHIDSLNHCSLHRLNIRILLKWPQFKEKETSSKHWTINEGDEHLFSNLRRNDEDSEVPTK